MKILSKQIAQELILDNNDKIVLLDMLEASEAVPTDEVQKNIYRIDEHGYVKWQIKAEEPMYPRSPFTGIYFEGNTLHAYCWDGIEYEVDVKTGSVTPIELLK